MQTPRDAISSSGSLLSPPSYGGGGGNYAAEMDGADRHTRRSAPDVTGSVWDQIRSATALVSGLDLVEGGVGKIDVFRVHLLLAHPQALAEALEVHDLPLPQEPDNVVDVRVVAQAQNVVIGEPSLLLCCNHIRTTFD